MPVCLHIAYAADDASLSGCSELLLNLLLYWYYLYFCSVLYFLNLFITFHDAFI